MADNNQLQIFRPENVQLITSNAPQALSDNQQSHARCLAAGNAILQLIQQQGMTDEIDQQAASFIDKARKTVARCNERRSPFTNLFDVIRTQFTALENDIDPTKKGTVPFQLQQYRNEYAARKRAEEEQRRRAAIAEQQKAQALEKYRTDVEADYIRIFNLYISKGLAELMRLNNEVTLDNYDQNVKKIQCLKDDFPMALITTAQSNIPLPFNADESTCADIRTQAIQKLTPTFLQKYREQITEVKHSYLATLPSKKAELERAAAASAEEAERIRQQIAERDRQEAERKQREIAEQQERERQKAELAQQQAAMAGAFDASAAAMPSYQPKTSVKKIIEVVTPSGFQAILNLWWVEEGQFLSLEELAKMFKKQVSFVVKLANDKENPRFINDPSIRYVEDVKAK
ncbi:MAG: hypothetical protein MJZ12_01465 [Prevotella sp.]|nr:hypothetical protein [Prevotella sp.]